jgi:hypothetical protein
MGIMNFLGIFCLAAHPSSSLPTPILATRSPLSQIFFKSPIVRQFFFKMKGKTSGKVPREAKRAKKVGTQDPKNYRVICTDNKSVSDPDRIRIQSGC